MSADAVLITHMVGPDGLFGATALCGTDAQDRILRQTEILDDVDCQVCLGLLPVGDA